VGCLLRILVAASVILAAPISFVREVPIASAATPVPSFAGCWPKAPQTRPASILAACGDGNFIITGISWASWTAVAATGAGIGHQNDCTPDCARGHFHRYRVSLRLYRPVRCQNGRHEFTRFAWRFVGTKPSNGIRGGTDKSPFYTGVGCP
jgi:hypothetical protein